MRRQLVVLMSLLSLGPTASRAAQQGPSTEESLALARAKRAAFRKLREITKNEPTAKEVQRATLRFYKLEPERINRLATAARLKGLMPQIDGGIDNSLGNNRSTTQQGLYSFLAAPGRSMPFYEQVTGASDQFMWRVHAVWDLDLLVFNAEELDAKSLTSIEENLLREVTTLYFSRKRLLANLVLNPADSEEDQYYDHLKLDELTSTLDAMTGGMFEPRAWKGDSDK